MTAGELREVGDHAVDIAETDRALKRATVQVMAREAHKAIRGTGGYHTRWPRRGRGRRRRGQKVSPTPPSIRHFRVAARVRRHKSTILVRHRQAKGVLLELRREIRGHRNRHHGAAAATVIDQWEQIAAVAARDAPARVEAARRSAEARRRRLGLDGAGGG